MLNCVNALEQHLPGMEQAGLVVAEEKTQQDSCKRLIIAAILFGRNVMWFVLGFGWRI